MTDAVGCSAAISLARFGPDTTATWPSVTPRTSTTTSLIRLSVPSSTPLARLTIVAAGSMRLRHAVRLWRRLWLGTASTTVPAPFSATRGSEVDRRFAGSSTPGRESGTPRRSPTASATSRRRAQSVTSLPASASTLAYVVPHEPAPKTAIGPMSGILGFALLARLPGLARRVELRGRLLLADLRQLLAHAVHQHVGDLAQQLVVDLAVPVDRHVHGRCHVEPDPLAREGAELLGVAVEDLVGPPPRGGHHGPVVLHAVQREPGDAGARVHRPALGVLGDRPLGVDQHELAVAQC